LFQRTRIKKKYGIKQVMIDLERDVVNQPVIGVCVFAALTADRGRAARFLLRNG
jgi:hypothetical protein